jgi:hypothetical protein
LGLPLPAEQTVNFVFHDAVALADVRLEPITIQNADATTAVMDQSSVLQVSCGYRYALSTSTEHIRDELLGHQQIRVIFPVVAQEQPTTESLFHRMQSVAHGGLGNLRDEGLRVSQKQALKRPGTGEFLLQPFRRQPERISGYGDDSSAARRFSSQKDGDARNTVVSDQTHLGGRPVLHGAKQGNN